MMASGQRTVIVFGACLAVLLGGVAWISLTAVRLDRAELAARREAALEENVRLALWRLDSDLMPLVARESTRPPFAKALPPQPRSPHVRAYFRIDADGPVSVDGADVSALRPLAPVIERAARAEAGRPPPGPAMVTGAANQQAERGSMEWAARSKSYRQAEESAYSANNAYLGRDLTSIVAEAETMAPLWVGGELVLVRRVDGRVEGCWLDWPGMRAWLLDDVKELLPAAHLLAATRPDRSDAGRFLAALPLELLPGPAPGVSSAGAPLRLVLGIAWSGVLLALAAGVALLAGAMALSERRAAFVSAVTHELRTPLTTFRAYTEMLADGMVTDETQKTQYLSTLKGEAERLSHLVENVLMFARVERGRGGELTRPLGVAELLERVAPRLVDRAAAAGMEVAVAPVPADLTAVADAGALEQILFNLVDNACKYAARATDRTIRISAAPAGRDVIVTVADRGPGIPAAERARLFRPFGRSAAQAAGNAPGVGLGLALCRRLARAMRGDLVLESQPGAVFSLRLRAAR